MATHKNDPNEQAFYPNGPLDGAGSILSTVGGPSDPAPPESLGFDTAGSVRLLEKVSEDAELAAEGPYNATKGLEYGLAAHAPRRGEVHNPDTPLAGIRTRRVAVLAAFKRALAGHKVYVCETDPPRV